jgi:hypothetical protein
MEGYPSHLARRLSKSSFMSDMFMECETPSPTFSNETVSSMSSVTRQQNQRELHTYFNARIQQERDANAVYLGMVIDSEIRAKKNEIEMIETMHTNKLQEQAVTYEKELNYVDFELMTQMKYSKMQLLIIQDRARQLESVRDELKTTRSLLLESNYMNSVLHSEISQKDEMIAAISLELSVQDEEMSTMVDEMDQKNEAMSSMLVELESLQTKAAWSEYDMEL